MGIPRKICIVIIYECMYNHCMYTKSMHYFPQMCYIIKIPEPQRLCPIIKSNKVFVWPKLKWLVRMVSTFQGSSKIWMDFGYFHHHRRTLPESRGDATNIYCFTCPLVCYKLYICNYKRIGIIYYAQVIAHSKDSC